MPNDDKQTNKPMPTRHIEPSMGASDSNSGGGNAGGAPDAETAMRVGDPAHDADVKADRAKLFPGQSGRDDDSSSSSNK